MGIWLKVSTLQYLSVCHIDENSADCTMAYYMKGVGFKLNESYQFNMVAELVDPSDKLNKKVENSLKVTTNGKMQPMIDKDKSQDGTKGDVQ